jgi:hypothetical protein
MIYISKCSCYSKSKAKHIIYEIRTKSFPTNSAIHYNYPQTLAVLKKFLIFGALVLGFTFVVRNIKNNHFCIVCTFERFKIKI